MAVGDAQRRRDRHELRHEERAAARRLGEDERGGPSLLLGGDRAHRQEDRDQRPELAEVLRQLVVGIGRRRRRAVMIWN